MNKRGKLEISCYNFFKKNRRGQYYLVAGIIIIGIIIGFIVIVNYAKKGQTVMVDDLKNELKFETQKVLEYDISHGGETMRQYGEDYSSHLGNSSLELYFIMGGIPSIVAYKYVNGDETPLGSVDTEEDKIIFNLDDINYEFDLLPGENFYFLISQEIKGERFVGTG